MNKFHSAEHGSATLSRASRGSARQSTAQFFSHTEDFMKKIALSELILDPEIYPRAEVSSMNVSSIKNALRAGITLPPIIIDKKSRRIIDGAHRVTAMKSL